jgi:predicted transglutaminase-like cysteine proteinase
MKFAARACVCAVTALTLFHAADAFASRTDISDNSFSTTTATADSSTINGSPITTFGAHQSFGGDLARFTQWTDMQTRNTQEQAATKPCAQGEASGCTPREWTQLIAEMQGKSLRQKVEIANTAMNQHPYVPTEQNWHRAMYWESPFQFLRAGGQCQDYAIAKYELLRDAGVPANQLEMVVLHATALGADHAVLVAYVDGQSLVMDNMTAQIVPSNQDTTYRPYYALNENGWQRFNGGQTMSDRVVAYAAR